ncbi:hypothetical protein [Deinococcus altitudinis]|uniref:hypothetical protein n=1 Tax=Deinococcus altitudinis TaxID=468914 RepID=UPI0038925EA0
MSGPDPDLPAPDLNTPDLSVPGTEVPHTSAPGFLRRRNALWQRLRQMQPGTPEFDPATFDPVAFETLLLELSDLTGWSRERVLAGLGIGSSEEPGAG